MKKCYKCGVLKDLLEFYEHPQAKDNHLNKCKACCRIDARNNKTVNRLCLNCGKQFMANKNEVKRRGGGANTCSRKCWYQYMPVVLSAKWDKAGRSPATVYLRAHKFIYKKMGKAQTCEVCRSSQASVYHWANLSGKYQLEVNDWMQMCPSCHKNYDIKLAEKRGIYAMKSIGL